MARIRRHRRDTVQSPLETYLREINEMALLTADEEKELAHRIAHGDKLARDRMVRANLRLVVNIARGYIGKGLSLQDLIEEGNLGLLRAVQGFDPAVGTRFSTYASYWIKQSIKRALVNTAKPIRIPAYMVELLFKWRRMAADLQESTGRPPSVEDVAKALKLPKKKLAIVKKAIKVYNLVPQTDQPENGWSLGEMLMDERTRTPDVAMVEEFCPIRDMPAHVQSFFIGRPCHIPQSIQPLGGDSRDTMTSERIDLDWRIGARRSGQSCAIRG